MNIGLICLVVGSLLIGTLSAEEAPVYVSNGGRAEDGEQRGIYRLTLDTETGALSEPECVAEVRSPAFLSFSPDGRFLYCAGTYAGAGETGLQAFAVNEDGGLNWLGSQPFAGSVPCHIQVDRTGEHVLVANYRSGNVVLLGIAEDGSVQPDVFNVQHEGSSVLPRQSGPRPHATHLSPDNQFVYVPDLGMDQVVVYKLDAERDELVLQSSGATPPGAGPRHMKISADGQRAWVLNEIGISLSAFERLETGKLTLIETVSLIDAEVETRGISASEIQIHPSGKFVYAAIRGGRARSELVVFEVDRSQNGVGELRRIQNFALDVATQRAFELDPTGRWAVVAGQRSHDLVVVEIDPATGLLSATPHRVNCPQPMSIAFQPLE